MKQLLFSLFFCLGLLSLNGQNASLLTSSGDTVVNTATKNLLLKVPNTQSVVSVQLVNTKISGTVAGKTYWQASNDGVNYVKLDSITNVNQTTNTKIFIDAPARYLHYRLSTTGSGTMSMKTYGYSILRSK